MANQVTAYDTVLHGYRRAVLALALELPGAVYDDFKAKSDALLTYVQATVEVQWCDEANGAYVVVCSAHGVVDYAPTEAESEVKATGHRSTHYRGTTS